MKPLLISTLQFLLSSSIPGTRNQDIFIIRTMQSGDGILASEEQLVPRMGVPQASA